LGPVCDFIETTEVYVDTLYGGHLNVSNAGDRMKTRIFGAVSAAESEIKSERLQSKMLQLAEDGKFAGGPRPFGFEADGIKPRTSEQAVIKAWAEGLLEGKSLRDLQRESAGLMTPRGKAWTYTTIGQLLKSPRIAGLRQHQGEVIGKADWEPVIDRETWERVRAILTDPSRKHRAPVRFLLTDFLYAQRLDADGNVIELRRMSGNRAVNGAKTEDGRDRRIYAAKPGGSVDALKVEEAVEIAVLDATDKTAFLKPAGQAKPVDTSAVEQAQADLDLIKARRDSGELDLEDYLDLIPTYRKALKEAQAAVKEAAPKALPPQAFAWLGKAGALRKHWPDMTPEERREALGYVLERVEVAPAVGQRFKADRLTFVYKA
jgi:hypothetical protein